MAESGRVALRDDQEWSGGPPGCTEVVERPSKCLGVVERQSRMSDKGWDALPDVRELSVGLP